jgi:tetratricopeptide (TPR) repeat protein
MTAGRMDEPLCPEARVAALVATLAEDEPRGTGELDALLGEYPGDPRLHFLKGSLLAGNEDYVAARAALRRAVDLAPDYAIARFQLGFLLLTCGEAHAAQEAWGPLHGLPGDDALRLMVDGLTHMIHDRFAEALDRLREGMARNLDNPALNGNIRLIVDELERKAAGGDDSPSPAQLLLQQAALKTRH